MIDWLTTNSQWIVPLSAVFTIFATIAALFHWFKKKLYFREQANHISNFEKGSPESSNGSIRIYDEPIRFFFTVEHPIAPNISAKIQSAVFGSLNAVFNRLVNESNGSKDSILPIIRVSAKVFWRGDGDPATNDNSYYIESLYLTCDIYGENKLKIAGFAIEGIDKSNWLGFWPDAINDAAKQLRKAIIK